MTIASEPSTTLDTADAILRLRSRCRGIRPLSARLEPWQLELLADPRVLVEGIGDGEAPINVIDPGPMGRNGAELARAATRARVDLRILFARKANKCISLVDRADELGYGVDVASLTELEEVVDRGIGGEDIVVTAAIKPEPLLRRCLQLGALVVVDNRDELRRLEQLAASSGEPGRVGIRLAPALGAEVLPTRFGVDGVQLLSLAGEIATSNLLSLEGLHFHLDGYLAEHRAVALAEAIALHDQLLPAHKGLRFIDIGGGIPMSYLAERCEWERFWQHHRRALLGQDRALTFDRHGLGLAASAGEVIGSPSVYPYWQEPVRGEWLDGLLAREARIGGERAPLARLLADRSIELRCEPGRSLLDGCGITVARVHFVKRRADGQTLVGLGMNRTQCRSTSDDFMVDPILLPVGEGGRSAPLSAYLVGAYCIERELITLRELELPEGVAVGDLMVLPNTAGYLMHILESSSHRMPLAPNLVNRYGRLERDQVDG